MVKVQKPNPKSLNKSVSGKSKNVPLKKSKDLSKEKAKKIGKNIQKDVKKEIIKEMKSKVAETNNKSKKIIKKDLKSIENRKEMKKGKKTKTTGFNTKSKESIQKDQNNIKTIESKVQKKSQKILEKNKTTFEKVEAKKLSVKKEVPQKVQSKIKQNQDKSTVVKVTNNKQETEQKSLFEPTNFDEVKFNEIVTLGNIKKITKALKTLVEKEVSEKKTSIFSDYKYFLNVASYKIPNCPKRMVKLNLKHSLVDPNIDDVVLIVPDLQRGSKVDYEPTVQHYEDLLREQDLGNIKIVPFNQLRNECTTFEAKRKFANTYDYFMCDGRIVSHVVGFCGKHFQKPRTTLHAARLNNPKTFKKDIDHALKRTAYKQLNKGDLISIPLGNDRFTTDQVAENVEIIIEQLKTLFPGGCANMRNIYLKIDIKGTSALPLYISLSGAPAEAPNVVGPREQKMLKLKKQANDILSKFSMTKTGDFVKLDKKQVERKQKLREARSALLAEDNEHKPPTKKAKQQSVNIRKEKEVAEESDDEIEENYVAGDEVEEEEEEDDELEEEDDDGVEEDDAEEDGDDDDVEDEDDDINSDED
ncbi:ribosomal L1 domain-containing protein CG13096 [Cochliomyia hominivorax]